MIGPVYVVTDAGAPISVPDQARAAMRGGAWAVQLRDKDAPDVSFAELARELANILSGSGTKLILNDRVELACALDVDGLHIGQSDGDPARIRERIGPDMLLGLSIENEDQCAALNGLALDYIGAGPVRMTPSKPDHAPPIGFDGLAEIVGLAPCPVVAIGGLGAGDAAALKQAGAVGMAVVSAVTRTADPEAATRALMQEWSAE